MITCCAHIRKVLFGPGCMHTIKHPCVAPLYSNNKLNDSKLFCFKAPSGPRGSVWVMAIVLINLTTYAQSQTGWKEIGALKTLNSKEIKSSRWSIGGETLDRDYADYNAYKSYLGALGAKRIRLQGGWARCEKVKGQYDFAWLDAIVDDAISQGVQPWLQTSYGNPIYEGGGDAALAGGLPTSAAALAAWDKWVAAFVKHFKGRVNEWEIWNEPDLSKKFSAKDYAVFYERTGTIIKQEQPKARLIGLALCCSGWTEYAQTFVDHLKAANKLDLINIVSFHGYQYRPENTYKNADELKKIILAAKPDATFWQGENGAPSAKKGEFVGAMKEYDWSELTQAKWNLRRMFGDMGTDLEVTNLFQISDMYYSSGDHMVGYNAKGLLKARPDRSIEKPKLAYYAFQHSVSVFSEKIARVKEAEFSNAEDLSAFAYKKKQGNLLTLWRSRVAPVEDSSENRKITFTVSNVAFKKPVYIDLITGKVHSIPASQFNRKGSTCTFSDITIPDYTIVIAEKSLIAIKKQG